MASINRNTKVLLMQPNFAIFGKRSWKLVPYNLSILKACLCSKYETEIYDPNFDNLTEEEIRCNIRKINPDVVGLTSFSTEYYKEIKFHTRLIKEEIPEALVIVGGVLPTVLIEQAIQDPNVDYFIMGEGEYRLPQLLHILESSGNNLLKMEGIAYRLNGLNVINPPQHFIDNLDAIPFPNYEGLDLQRYCNLNQKYAQGLIPRQFPFATTMSSRGCPYQCIFCAAQTVSGKKVRMRSSENIISEIDWLIKDYGVREVIFTDDHFLFSRKRALEIMQTIKSRNYGITWKCANVAIFCLNAEILELMRESGAYQLTISIESGDQDVLNKIIKKPVNLKKAKEIVSLIKSLDFEVICNFVFGFPGEKWDQIRRTIDYAENLDIDLVNFHIATPLPKTELMDICLQEQLIKPEQALSGYTHGVISTNEFNNFELQILRAFEWDRINFKTRDKIKTIARLQGISEEEVAEWRSRTRKSLGTTINWKE